LRRRFRILKIVHWITKPRRTSVRGAKSTPPRANTVLRVRSWLPPMTTGPTPRHWRFHRRDTSSSAQSFLPSVKTMRYLLTLGEWRTDDERTHLQPDPHPAAGQIM